jgi:hypothetical protein
MDPEILARPEVLLNACPADGESLFRVFDAEGPLFECLSCGYKYEGDFRAFA